MIPALLLLAQIVPVPAEPKPVTTTIAAIRTNPKKFDGQIVRVHGYVKRCSDGDCSVEDGGNALSIAADPKFDSTVRPLLPTYVEFDARFNSQCLKAACAGRPPVLTVVTLRSVVSPEPPAIEN